MAGPAHRGVRRLALWALLFLAGGTASAAQPLGRLFFTPEQRATLEALRLQPASSPAMRTDRIKVNGIIQRSGSPPTVWINGVPRAALPDEVVAPAGNRSAPAVQVTVPGKEERVRLKVGQSVDISGEEAPTETNPPPAPRAAPAPPAHD
jgi:hypothetical protein